MRNDVPGSMKPLKIAVAVARAMPPSTKMAWQTHGPVQGVSSCKVSTLRPNKTQGQNYVYVFLNFRVVIIKKREIVEASFMMMNQFDSSSFDNDKDDDKKPKEWFQD